MSRVKITLSYNGAAFMGFQHQSHTPDTIMGELIRSARTLGIDALPQGSGRTDRGVHATGQVIHLDLPPFWTDLERLRTRFNLSLPKALHLRRIEWVDETFHARYSATRRTYRYVLRVGESNPFEADRITFVSPLDTAAMLEAIGLFEGEHDFEFFKKNGSEVSHYVRHMYRAYGYEYRGYWVLVFEANGFLRSQIRMMVAFLLAIGRAEATPQMLCQQLAKTHHHRNDLAPPQGLYLSRIKY